MDASRILQNKTLLAVRAIPMDDHRGRDVVVTIAKLTWEVDPIGRVRFAVPRRTVRWGDDLTNPTARWSSVRYPTDLAAAKLGTDVLMVGTAHPNPSQPNATSVNVSVRVETGNQTLAKTVRVHGARVWMKGATGVSPGPAAKLRPTPITFERSWGGYDDTDLEDIAKEMRNPAGNGVVRDRKVLVDTPAPAVEDPNAAVGSARPAPASFGAVHASWLPRFAYYGTVDHAWRRERAPIVPIDFDPRFESLGPQELWSSRPLRGDEPVEIQNATPEGVWRFQLPHYAPWFKATVRGVVYDLPTHLDTYVIDADERVVELTWRSAIPIPKRVAHLEQIEVGAGPELPDWMLGDVTERLDSWSDENHSAHHAGGDA